MRYATREPGTEKRIVIETILASFFAVFCLCISLIYFGNDLRTWWREQTTAKLPIEDPGFLYARAESYYRSGDLGIAHDIANRATLVEPDYAPAHKLLATIALKEKKFAVAEKALRRAQQLDPSDDNVKLGLGLALDGQGKSEEAAATYKSVTEKREADPEQQAFAEEKLSQHSGKPAPEAKP